LKASDCVLSWLLLIEEYGVTFEYLPGKKIVVTIVDDLSRHEIDSLKIQEEEVEELTLFSGSENIRTSNIKTTTPIYTVLIFKEQTRNKSQVKYREGLSPT
jgi:hypothetical protein